MATPYRQGKKDTLDAPSLIIDTWSARMTGAGNDGITQ